MERFKIFPSIGIARVGGSSTEYFVCPENENSLGIDVDSSGNENELTSFKDPMGLIKRQAARFKIYELNTETNEYLLGNINVLTVEWRVHLVNKKSALKRFEIDGMPLPPDQTHVPQPPLQLRDNGESLIIDPGPRKIKGKSQHGISFDTGKYKSPINQVEQTVYLGELKTDKDGNLIVLGGKGISKSPSDQPVGPSLNPGGEKTPDANFYYNKDWYDDTSDGIVEATIELADGTKIDAVKAWVIVAPPDYAPKVKGVVTLYDVIENVIKGDSLNEPLSFKKEIFPIISRYEQYQWVQVNQNYSLPHPVQEYSKNSTANKTKRQEVRDTVLKIQQKLKQFRLTSRQIKILQLFVDGKFVEDLSTPSNSSQTGEEFTKLILDTTIGQGFFPGIEGGRILTNKNIYMEPFRIDAGSVKPGEITGLMALPWQADFLECVNAWWPSQRPDLVRLKDGTTGLWHGPLNPDSDHKKLVDEFNRFGFVKPSTDKVQIEDERDPTFARV
ncbi:LodA/GoxA family CTQ-dependent oxidase [Parafilimonas sp.]|uniref:LodA/GoxA family CTQ-dependent oxidase n=1 Tax=Parafilimonas sp. TaxID=1969739 RepID=UPI0039E50910